MKFHSAELLGTKNHAEKQGGAGGVFKDAFSSWGI